jgi:hypothetical protein
LFHSKSRNYTDKEGSYLKIEKLKGKALWWEKNICHSNHQ